MRGQLTLTRQQGRFCSSVAERVKFLLDNPGVCEMSPETIVQRLKELGYIAKTTYWKDVRVGSLLDLVDVERAKKGLSPIYRRE